MKRKSRISKCIPEEIIIDILSRLPLKTLHRFKWVSKSWHSLITQETLPKTINPQLLGLLCRSFYGVCTYISTTTTDAGNNNNTTIDPKLSFWHPVYKPSNVSNFCILDCCNGLVLCRSPIRYAHSYDICNPFTKSLVELPSVDYIPYHNMIDFDPSISPHYKVVAAWKHRNRVFINVYRSEIRSWELKRMNLKNCILRCSHHLALWDGGLYVTAHFKMGSLINGSLCEGYKTVRFGLSGGDADDFELIKFPNGTGKPIGEMHLGRVEGRLCSACLKGLRLQVWTLRGKRENEWVLKHDRYIRDLSGRDMKGPPHIAGFHPLRNAILILFKTEVFAYDLEEMSLVEICRIGKENENVFEAVFPFLPCSYDILESPMKK